MNVPPLLASSHIALASPAPSLTTPSMYCPPIRPSRSSTSSASHTGSRSHNTPLTRTPRSGTPTPGPISPTLSMSFSRDRDSYAYSPVQAPRVKRVTLTSKKNWWMVEMDDNEDDNDQQPLRGRSGPPAAPTGSFSSSDDTAVSSHAYETPMISQPYGDEDPGSRSRSPTPSPSSTSHIFSPPDRHPSVIFSFPTPTAYAAPPNATSHLAPFAQGSTSELFRCVVKKPEVVQLEVNGELSSNAADVTTQFLAELRVYTSIGRHRNIVGFLGCLEGVGMVLEYVDGRTLLDVLRAAAAAVAARSPADSPTPAPALDPARKIAFHNQLLDALAHLHRHGLSHGDLSLQNVYVTQTDTLKLLDFGRSVAADSDLAAPHHAPPEDPFSLLQRTKSGSHTHYPSDSFGGGGGRRRKVEQIHRGTRPFSAPEVLRGECTDARLADAYSFGVMLVCIDQCALVDCAPEVQMRDEIPRAFVEGCSAVFAEKVCAYMQCVDRRRRIVEEDLIAVKRWWDEE